MDAPRRARLDREAPGAGPDLENPVPHVHVLGDDPAMQLERDPIARRRHESVPFGVPGLVEVTADSLSRGVHLDIVVSAMCGLSRSFGPARARADREAAARGRESRAGR